MQKKIAVFAVLLASVSWFACSDFNRPVSLEQPVTNAISVDITSTSINRANESASFTLNADVVLNASGESDVHSVSFSGLDSIQQNNLDYTLTEYRTLDKYKSSITNSSDREIIDAEPLFK